MSTNNNSPVFIKSVGFLMALVMILSQLINAVRAFADPLSFAVYMGLPLASDMDVGFVGVYGLRALFLCVFATALIVTQQFRALSLLALFAVLMPIGDLILAAQAQAPVGIVIRHALTGVFLLLAWFFLNRWCNTNLR